MAAENQKCNNRGCFPNADPSVQAAGRGAQRVWRELRNWAMLLGSPFEDLP